MTLSMPSLAMIHRVLLFAECYFDTLIHVCLSNYVGWIHGQGIFTEHMAKAHLNLNG